MCPVPMPGPDNAVEDMRMPKKTVLQHPKTCAGGGNGYSPQVQGREAGAGTVSSRPP